MYEVPRGFVDDWGSDFQSMLSLIFTIFWSDLADSADYKLMIFFLFILENMI